MDWYRGCDKESDTFSEWLFPFVCHFPATRYFSTVYVANQAESEHTQRPMLDLTRKTYNLPVRSRKPRAAPPY